jgi:hypothetical protein
MNEGSGNTLSPLSGAAAEISTAPTSTIRRETDQDRWYELHHAAVRRHRDDIWALRDELAEAPDDTTRAALCSAGLQIDRPAYERAHDAPGAHPDWIRSVDLTRWMVATCSSGAVESVAEILPLLDDALVRFDGWLSSLPPDGC